MAVPVIMPKAGMAMEEGTVREWFKQEGDTVEAGEPLLEIETDKVNMEIEATDSGVLLQILNEPGDVVPVTQAIAYIGAPGETIETRATEIAAMPDIQSSDKNTVEEAQVSEAALFIGKSDKIAATPLARRLAAEQGIDLAAVIGTGSFGEIKARDIENLIRKMKVTPLAKKVAQEKQIDVMTVQGSGPGGRVLKDDILHQESPALIAKSQTKGIEQANRKPLQGIRKIIADRMLQSHLQAPQVTLNAKADVTALVAFRQQLNEQLEIKISLNDFILKAAAMTLKEMPHINVSIESDEILYHTAVNIGVAVALEDGLVVPVIKQADTLSLKQISLQAKDLASKAREGKLLPDDYAGGTFTISNLGMYGITAFTPIINPPESAILGVCAIEEELKLNNGELESQQVMGLSLTIDHRVLDGAQGAVFLQRITGLLEHPLELAIS
jgi:pyruvate dehydrogenase E2 component (dihydrolipoamide acetyltransferase)